MRVGIKAKQIAGVTAIVGVAVVALSGLYVTRLAGVVLNEASARGQLLSDAILHRAREVVPESADAYTALGTDSGLRSILEASIYGESVTDASIIDTNGVIIASSDTILVGTAQRERADLAALLEQRALQQLQVIYAGEGQTLEVRQPITLGDEAFGSIVIGVSTLLMRQELNALLRPAIITAAMSLLIAVIVAALLAQLLLRPIHVIRSGLTRLGKGEFGVTLDLPPGDEFSELGTFFNKVSAQLSADRTQMADQVANLESAVEHLQDAVAIVSPAGEILFANPAMRTLIPHAAAGAMLSEAIDPRHLLCRQADETFATQQSLGPTPVTLGGPGAEAGERQLLTHPVNDAKGEPVGVMLIVRNLEYLSQVQSTIR